DSAISTAHSKKYTGFHTHEFQYTRIRCSWKQQNIVCDAVFLARICIKQTGSIAWSPCFNYSDAWSLTAQQITFCSAITTHNINTLCDV
ncbi:hypothetical protein GCK32_001937, partial [Trichostrongylus colubriformis]